MGSLPADTLCVYCEKNHAGYIPDGCIGPMCFEDGEGNLANSCYEKLRNGGMEAVDGPYLLRRWASRKRTLSKAAMFNDRVLDSLGEDLAVGCARFVWYT